jgi:tRNA(fMet)-specific endonuclease VapC
MILLDTDHLSVVTNAADARNAPLRARLRAAAAAPLAVPIVSVEEQCQGWLAQINRQRDVHKQVATYERLAKLLEFLADWEIVRFDERAADEFKRLRKQGVRIGTHDLKIASIALARQALLLSANLRDFRRVPGLAVESWLV